MSSIDITIPNYNYGHYLERCVRSIQSQSIEDLRIRIIDNASTDNSVEIAERLAAADPRISISVHEKNLGVHASINEGIEWAEADYFLMLTADDMLAPGSLARARAILDEHGEVVFAFGHYLSFYEDDVSVVIPEDQQDTGWNILDGSDYLERCCNDIIRIVSPLVRTRFQKQVPYTDEIYYLADLHVFMRLAALGKVAETTAVQSLQGLHQSNISVGIWSNPMRNFNSTKDLINLFFGAGEGTYLPNSEALRIRALRRLGKRAYWSALSRLMRGDVGNALKLMRFSLALNPVVAIVPPLDQLTRYEDFEVRFKNAFSLLTSRRTSAG